MYCPEREYSIPELIQKADCGDREIMRTAVELFEAEDYLADGEIRGRYLAYLETLAGGGDPEACIRLGDACLNGTAGPQDPGEAVLWYEKAAELGNGAGYERIGRLYYEGKAVPADYRKAFEFFARNKGQESFETLYALGEMYQQGLYVSRDLEKACRYYRRIVYADIGFPELDAYYARACRRLAEAMRTGDGEEPDPDEAGRLMEKARAC